MSRQKQVQTPAEGLAGWLLEAWAEFRARRGTGRGAGRGAEREMKLLETIPMGGQKQLHLVSCAGERFLVGAGADRVDTIVPVRAEAAAAMSLVGKPAMQRSPGRR